MALWFHLSLNSNRIGAVEIRRVEFTDLTDPAALADRWFTYSVIRDGDHLGHVRHVYGHGAWRLLALAADLIVRHDTHAVPVPYMVDKEAAAQTWHDSRVSSVQGHEQFSSCWCCCISCDPDSAGDGGNPHFAEAMASMRVDMASDSTTRDTVTDV